jgi:hypothetical protein
VTTAEVRPVGGPPVTGSPVLPARHFTHDGATAICDLVWGENPSQATMGLTLTRNTAHIGCVPCWVQVPLHARYSTRWTPCGPDCPVPHYEASAKIPLPRDENRCCPDRVEAARLLCGCRG